MSEPRLVRAASVRALDGRDVTLIVGDDRVVREFRGDPAGLVRAVLDVLQTPHTRGELLAALAARVVDTTPGAIPEEPVDALLALLRATGAVAAAPAGAAVQAPLTRRVVLGVSGAIAAVDAPALVRLLHARGCEVRVALTREARRFVSPAALEALTHHAAYRGLWHRTATSRVPHIDLAAWAEAVVVYPASATTLARIAHGDCSDLVAAVVTATCAPVLLAPSMNAAMLASPAVARALGLLRDDGRWIVYPSLGAEVAHPPGARPAVLGPAAAPVVVADLVEVVLKRAAARPPGTSVVAG